MDKPVGEDNFITIDEFREHWDVSDKTIRRHIKKKISAEDRERCVKKVALGHLLEDGVSAEHFYYLIDRDFWNDRFEIWYPSKRKYVAYGHGLDRGPDKEEQLSTEGLDERLDKQKGGLDSIPVEKHEVTLKEWKDLYYHERAERKAERAERQALIQENIKLVTENRRLLALQSGREEEQEGAASSDESER